MTRKRDPVDGRKKSGTKKPAERQFHLTVRNAAKKSGTTTVDFSALGSWLDAERFELFSRSLKRYAARYSTATQVYGLRFVLKEWARISVERHWPLPNATQDGAEFMDRLGELRTSFFETFVKRGNLLTTVSFNWTCFRMFLYDLAAEGAVPRIDTEASVIANPPRDVVQIRRSQAILRGVSHRAQGPRSLNLSNDSYNEDLIVPISISDSSETYLSKYEAQLEHALGQFHSYALFDFEGFELKYRYGLKCEQAPESIIPIPGNFMSSELPGLLARVRSEMGGIPTSELAETLKVLKQKYRYTYDSNRDFAGFTKGGLLPFLGILTSEVAAACMVLLLLEHPQLNATSLARARAIDENGRSIMVFDATEDGKTVWRLVLNKPRAKEQRAVVLSPLAKHVIKRVLEWTYPVRCALWNRGDRESAQKLWVGMSMLDYRIMSFSERALYNAFRGANCTRDWGENRNATRRVPFVERHFDLRPWSQRATYKGLRVSAGVLHYLKTGGDLVATAQAFGHRNIKTTIGHYIPEALRLAIYERQIRRHQNRLIVDSAASHSHLLKSSDFRTVEELHEFLHSLVPIGEALATRKHMFAGEAALLETRTASTGRLVLASDPDALAIALLYREHLRGASNAELDRPDLATRIAPRFWRDFVDCITAELPLAFQELSLAVKAAELQVPGLARHVTFPRLVK